MEQILVEGFRVHVKRPEVLRLLGSSKGTLARHTGRVEQALSEAIELAAKLMEPKAVFAVTSGADLPGPPIFAGMEKMAFCICTIGPGLEEKVSELSGEGQLLRAIVLDAVGSAAAEEAASMIDDIIKEKAAGEGLKTSCRASPGYGSWDVSGQKDIFEILDAERIGVRLSESFMMIPRKSVSFAIHIAREPARLRSENSCANCDLDTCSYRKKD